MLEDLEQMSRIPASTLEKLRDTTVLVTGATGMLGKYIVCWLMHLNQTLHLNIRILASVRNEQQARAKFESFLGDDNFQIVVHDIVQELHISEEVHYVLHTAGLASAHAISETPVEVLTTNTLGTLRVLDFARTNPIKSLLLASTREIYGATTGLDKISENDMGVVDPLDLRSCYPESKRLSEAAFFGYYHQFGIPMVIGRIAHGYGPGMSLRNDGRVMADFLYDALSQKEIVITGDPNTERAFCYVGDVVEGLLLMLLDGRAGSAYNLANETEPVTLLALANLVATAAQNDCKVTLRPNPNRKGYLSYKRTPLDTRKIEDLGWKPQVRIEDGIRRTFLSFGSTLP